MPRGSRHEEYVYLKTKASSRIMAVAVYYNAIASYKVMKELQSCIIVNLSAVNWAQ